MCRLLLACFLLVVGCVIKANAASEPWKIEIEISPEFSAYVGPLFSAPAYAVLALQNSGSALSLSTPAILESRTSFRVGALKVRFLELKGKTYHYSSTMTLPFGKEIVIPIELDTSEMERGKLLISAYLPLSILILEQLRERVETKLQMLSTSSHQTQLLAYLVERSSANLGNPAVTAELFDTIAFDSFNQLSQSSEGPKRVVEASGPVSDPHALFLALFIWIAGFPVFLYLVRRQKRGQANT